MISDAAEKSSNDQSQISLVVLSEYAIADTPELVLTLLAKHGYLAVPTDWGQLSGGLEYNHYLVDPITIDAIVSRLLVEITRAQEQPEHSWVNGFELQPATPSHSEWLDKMHVVLARDFEAGESNESGVAKFTRGGTECLLVPSSTTQPARLLLHRRLEIDGPS